jgi:hypothetical protein
MGTPTWADVVEEIDGLLESERYAWGHQTLRDIRATILQTRAATVGQRQAVRNIRDARRSSDDGLLPSQRRGGSRRYEGCG